VSALATSGRTVADVLARVKDNELPLFQMLCLSGLISLSGAARAADPRAAQAIAAAAAENEDRGKSFKPQEETARRMLQGERERLKDATHYEVLGIDPSASESDVKKAYIAAAKKFHSDGFAGMELGSARRVAEELFAKVGEASSVLSDKKKRAEYDVYVDRKAKGLPTDVAAILRAEGIFQRGEVQFKQGKWDDAEQSFREAIALNHAEAEFHAYLGMAVFRKTGKPEVAYPHVEKSLELDPRLKSGTLFAAQLAEASGDVDRAQGVLKKALQRDPSFAEAKDALRRLRNRPAQQQNKGGLLSRLLSKK
jgi:curved DNA-binding protein CbpA